MAPPRGPTGAFEPDYPQAGGVPNYTDAAYQTLAELAHGQPLPPGLPSYVNTGQPSLVEQAAAPVETAAKKGGKLGSLKAILGDAKSVKAGDMTVPEFVAEHGTLVGGLLLPAALQYGSAFAAHDVAGSEFGKIHPDVAPAIGTIGRDAAIGAGIGTMVPIPGVGTATGALAGGIVGGLQTLFGGHHKSPQQALADQESTVWTQLGATLPADQVAAVQNEYNSVKGSYGQAMAANYLQQVQQTQAQSLFANAPGLGQQNTDQTLALQSQIAGMMGPYMQQQSKASGAQIDAFMRAATPEGQKISAATQHLGDMYKANNQQITDSYILQAQSQPLLDQMASTLYQKGITASATGSSGGSIASLLAGNAGVASGSGAQPNLSPAITASNYGANNQLTLQ